MNILNGIKNLLSFLYNNWTTIIIILGFAIGLYKKIKAYLAMSKEEKLTAAKAQLKEILLGMMTDAEEKYADWNKSGSIKRSQVIKEIFEKYPILSKIANQDDIIRWIDNEINQSLVTLQDIVNKQ